MQTRSFSVSTPGTEQMLDNHSMTEGLAPHVGGLWLLHFKRAKLSLVITEPGDLDGLPNQDHVAQGQKGFQEAPLLRLWGRLSESPEAVSSTREWDLRVQIQGRI